MLILIAYDRYAAWKEIVCWLQSDERDLGDMISLRRVRSTEHRHERLRAMTLPQNYSQDNQEAPSDLKVGHWVKEAGRTLAESNMRHRSALDFL